MSRRKQPGRFRFLGGVSRALLILYAMSLSACESLPHDGPSAKQVAEAAVPDGPYGLVDLDYRVSQLVAANPPRALAGLTGASSQAPIDRIGPGDVLNVWVYQADSGPALSAAGLGPSLGGRGSSIPSTPNLTVETDGTILAPYVGVVRVAGLTAQQASDVIRRGLVGKVNDPQAVVTIAANLSNTVTVTGEARAPGRFPLTPSSDHLLDILALAGGSVRPQADVEITMVRGDRSATSSLAAVMANPAENVRLAPRDQIRLTYKPRKFSTFGALTRAAQVPIEDDHLTLAAAISRMGGLNPTLADATSVMVFRFERPEVAQALSLTTPAAPDKGVPVIYRLNLRQPSGYFVANTFEVAPEDLIFVPHPNSVEVRGFFDLVSQITRVAYDVSVSRVLR